MISHFMTTETANVPALQLHLVDIARQTNALERQRSAIMREYVPGVKNKLMGYVGLFGKQSLRRLGRYGSDANGGYEEYIRGLYFEDIHYRSKLRKIRDKITGLGEEYATTLGQIKSLTGQKTVN